MSDALATERSIRALPPTAAVLELEELQLEALRGVWFSERGPDYKRLTELVRAYGWEGDTTEIFRLLGVRFNRELLGAYPNAQRDFVFRMVAACLKAGGSFFETLSPGLRSADVYEVAAVISDSLDTDDDLFVRNVDEFNDAVDVVVDSIRDALALPPNEVARGGQREALGRVRSEVRRFLKTELLKIPQNAPEPAIPQDLD